LRCLLLSVQMDSQADSASTASTADMDIMAGENGMDDLISDSDAASFRYIRLVVYSARNVLCKDYSGFSDPYALLYCNISTLQQHLEFSLVA
jgi:hypothetical protein